MEAYRGRPPALIDRTTGRTYIPPLTMKPKKSSGPSFGARLRAWRSKAGLTQKEAASTLGLPSVRTLEDWELERHQPNGLARVMLEKVIR